MALKSQSQLRSQWLCSVAAAAVLLLATSTAEARIVTLKWTHEQAERVDYYVMYARVESELYYEDEGINVGIPAQDRGIYSHTIEISDTEPVCTAIRAVDGTVWSAFSNDRCFPLEQATTDSALYDSQGFAAYSIGSDPMDWLDTAADSSMIQDDSLFKTFDLGGNTVFGTTSAESHIHSHFVGSGSDALSSYEYSGRMLMSQSSSSIGITVHSQYNVSDVYYRLLSAKGDSFRVRRHPEGTPVTCSKPDSGVVPEPSTWYRFRLQVAPESDGTWLTAKVWKDGEAEPSTWQVDCYDIEATRLVGGTFGVWSSLSGAKYWDDLKVSALTGETVGKGSGGETSEPPLGQPGVPTLVDLIEENR